MKRSIFLTAIFLMVFTTGFAQTNSDSISAKKIFGGYQYFQNETPLTVNQLMETLETNKEAYRIIKNAKGSYDFAMVLSYAGGFCIGYPIGTALGGGEPNWKIAGIGAGLVLVAIPLSNKFNKKALEAVNIYNQDFNKTSFWDDKELKLTYTSNGLGLNLRF